MKFSSVVSGDGLVQDIDFLCHTDSANYPLIDKTRNINNWYRKAVSWIRETPSDWEYDDSRHSTLPIYTSTLVHNQQDYTLDSNAQKVRRVEILDSSGDYVLLTPINSEEIRVATSEYYETAGLPQYYDLVGRSVILYPKPSSADVTTTAGIKMSVDRDISEFISTDTTAVPGIAANFHRILSFGAAFDFEEDPTKKNYLLGQVRELKSEIQNFYATRHKEGRTQIKPRKQNYR